MCHCTLFCVELMVIKMCEKHVNKLNFNYHLCSLKPCQMSQFLKILITPQSYPVFLLFNLDHSNITLFAFENL